MQVPRTLDRCREQSPDGEACLESRTPTRRAGGFLCPEIDEPHLGETISRGPRGRGAPNERLLRQLQEPGHRFEPRAKEDE